LNLVIMEVVHHHNIIYLPEELGSADSFCEKWICCWKTIRALRSPQDFFRDCFASGIWHR
jgi:hypothetical protein